MKLKTGNNYQDQDFMGEIKFTGNWNYKDKLEKEIISKPLGIHKLGNGLELVWKHSDIFDLIKLYNEADKVAMNMIHSKFIDTGKVDNTESSFKDKLKEFIDEL